MEKQLYRKESLKHISSPEEMHDFLCVTTPRLWMILSTILVLLVGFLIYASTVTLENTISAQMRAVQVVEPLPESNADPKTYLSGEFPMSYEDLFSPGMTVRLGTETGKIVSVYTSESAKVLVTCLMDNGYIPLEEDVLFDVEIVVEKTTPISFLWK